MKLHKLVSGPAARAGSACPAARVTPLGSAAAHRHHHHRQVCRAAYVPDQRADQPSSARHPKHPHHHEEAGPQHTAFANQLEALRAMSVVVADTGEPALVAKIKPVDCTTNPSLVYKAMQVPEYQHHLAAALAQDRERATRTAGGGGGSRPYAGVADVLAVNLGAEMLKLVPGRVSTEVDAHLSFDTQATVDKALELVDLYSSHGVGPDRLYIKIASTWEGIKACERLQRQGIDCNMTLLFSFAQAAACADVGAALISPFVGRILDWYKEKTGREFAPHEDPGVLGVRRIYSYYKTHAYNTVVMAASFRNIGEIRELAGCDKITVSPQLLAELEACTEPLPRRLWPGLRESPDAKLSGITASLFSNLHDADLMAVEKLEQGILGFAADQKKLEAQIAKLAAEGAVRPSQ